MKIKKKVIKKSIRVTKKQTSIKVNIYGKKFTRFN